MQAFDSSGENVANGITTSSGCLCWRVLYARPTTKQQQKNTKQGYFYVSVCILAELCPVQHTHTTDIDR